MTRLVALLVVATACATVKDAPPPGDPWQRGPDLPSRRLEAAVAAVGTRLFVVGGFATAASEGLSITRDVLVYDTLAKEWSATTDTPVEWTHAGLAGAGGSLYLLGGLEGADFTPRGESYVLVQGSGDWLPLAPMPVGLERGAAAIVVAAPKIYVIGGADADSSVATVLVYDWIDDAWMQLPDLPRARSHPFAMRLPDGTLVVGGGLAELGGFALGDVYALRPGADVWELRTVMPTPRGGCAYGVALGQLVCAGGESGDDALVAVESYDPIGDEWTIQPPMPEPRAGANGAVIGQQLYVAGGASELVFQPTNSLFVFSLLDTLPRP